MKLEEFSKMSKEEREKWLGGKQLKFRHTRHGIVVFRYDPNRIPTEGEIKARVRFTEVAHSLKGTTGKTKRGDITIPTIAAKISKKLKIKK